VIVPIALPHYIDEVLDRAAERLELDGWAQGGIGDRQGRLTAAGAIAAVAAGAAGDLLHPQGLDATRALLANLGIEVDDAPDTIREVAREWAPTVINAVVAWNDAPDRTAGEVVEALRRAAARHRIATVRQAATLMRERAEAATGEAWIEGPLDPIPTRGVWAGPRLVATVHQEREAPLDSAHIASWSPGLAVDIASWLDEAADREAEHLAEAETNGDVVVRPPRPGDEAHAALLVARAYLGGDAR
jgi:hypothetical protein